MGGVSRFMTRSRRKLLYVSLAIPVVCAAGGYGLSWYSESVSTASLNEELARLERLGVAVTAPKDQLDPTQNAVHYYDLAAKSLGTRAPNLRDKPTVADIRAMQGFLAKHQDAIDLIEQGLKCERFVATEDWVGDQRTSMNHVRDRFAVAGLCLSQARLLTRRGQAAEAVEWLLNSEKVAAQCQGRSLIGALHYLLTDAVALDELKAEARDHWREPAFWDAVDRFNQNVPPPVDLRASFGGGVETARASLKDYPGGSGGLPDRYHDLLLRLPFVRRSVEARVVRSYRQLAECVGPGDLAWEQRAKQAVQFEREIQDDPTMTGFYVKMMMPRLSDIIGDAGKIRRARNETLAMAAVYRIRLKAGRFPETLPPSIPRDEVTGKALTYRIEKGVPIFE